jgi:hypothetical protein
MYKEFEIVVESVSERKAKFLYWLFNAVISLVCGDKFSISMETKSDADYESEV